MSIVLPLCDRFCDSSETRKTYMPQRLNECYFIRFVTLFVTNTLFSKNYLKFSSLNITKNPASKPPSWKFKRGSNFSKTKQYLENPDIKKQPPTARSLSAVHGAPNRIRTCGLLIRRASKETFEASKIKSFLICTNN